MSETVKIEMSADEKAILGAEQTISEPVKEEVNTKAKAEAKTAEPVKEAVKEEVKAEEKALDNVGEAFELTGKKKVDKEVTKEPLTDDERTELERLKQEKVERDYQTAFDSLGKDYDGETWEFMKGTISKLIDPKDSTETVFDKLYKSGFEAKQVAMIVEGLALKRHYGEIRANIEKVVKAKLTEAKQEAEAKKEVKEVANLSSESPKSKNPRDDYNALKAKARKGDSTAIDKMLDYVL